ncbi:uncharacterized protein A1O9_09729 [Exophiala aquamarina CBS 119918]|uniref:Vacuolar membrane-associated protein IML1 n=1 Tax=Exophiala aquamarina CBS 119918 TaxID=1182545 RepID=A0A072P1D5_9EURO|nr:uncharacterized protein A1O9_09729 [Exophiala aquamarina CBS 119918]KEF53934.1 hypothetical protein A1O9_09729 [Exophiala aquamarina CBS 119918]
MSTYTSDAKHRRTSSGSTVRARSGLPPLPNHDVRPNSSPLCIRATLWVHDDNFSSEDVLIHQSLFEGTEIQEGSLIEIYPVQGSSDVRDFQSPNGENDDSKRNLGPGLDNDLKIDKDARYLCVVKFAHAELKARQGLQLSIKNNIAAAFGLRSRSDVAISPASLEECTASHVELGFRDAYLSRSDMWRLVGQELAGKTVYAGQKISFLSSIKLTVKSIHIQGHKTPTAYFSGSTVPVFRSEAARYILFIQMSSEMWDFDSEGNGEIMFNRVINGFLPDLFKRWTELDVHHLVSIVLFGRLEYDRFDLARNKDRRLEMTAESGAPNMTARQYQDFYRVVVTDMASAQWTIILNEIKKDFRVFLRDISLHTANSGGLESETKKPQPIKIAGRPSTALKGNILEAINIACSQFANDYVDRDLIRTGVSIVVITAGTGVFEVNRDLLNLTSETLTNNGVGIDVVCLSRMPLHSVPLFKYRTPGIEDKYLHPTIAEHGSSPRRSGSGPNFYDSSQPRKLSPAISSVTSSGTHYMASYMSTQTRDSVHGWCYGIPQWIDLSYWSAEPENEDHKLPGEDLREKVGIKKPKKGRFQPRVRMYEIQMMGLMELGLADMTIPYMSETQNPAMKPMNRRKSKSSRHASGSRSISHSPSTSRNIRPGMETSRPVQGLLSSHTKALGDIFDRMDRYDLQLFQVQDGLKGISKKSKTLPTNARTVAESTPSTNSRSPYHTGPPAALTLSKAITNKPLNTPFRPQLTSLISRDATTSALKKVRSPETSKVNRTLNYSLRGLAPPVRASASTEVNITNAQALPLFSNPGHSRPTVATSGTSIRSVSMKNTFTEDDFGDYSPGDKSSILTSTRIDDTPSKPIQINSTIRRQHDDDRIVTPQKSKQQSREIPTTLSPREEALRDDRDSESASGSISDSGSARDDDSAGRADSWVLTSVASSITRSDLPSIRNVNASNPLKRHPERATLFGRWQHLYPRRPRAATVKWRSLCTPAAVPLTTEDFPSRCDLDTEYELTSYDVTLENPNDMKEIPQSRDTLLREMLALRFAHGYQLVVGSNLVETVGPGTCDTSAFFTPDIIRPDGSFIFMSMGNTIQRLSLQDADRIRVTKYRRRPRVVQPPFPTQVSYHPNIRTILSESYKIRDMLFDGHREHYPWEEADSFLGDVKNQTDPDVKALRFWRARFVLIPVQPPTNSWRPTTSESEETEEEIHLRGIRALTQMWQKGRYIAPNERRPAHNRVNSMKRKDKNPLRITLETLNPSELVATELDKLFTAEESGEIQATQLLPENEQFDTKTFKLSKLAQALQGDRGIEIKNRRWHLRLHYSCFQGEDLTNWLVHNFRDIDTRDEAVEFGNELMKEPDELFEHVNSRHKFKDGNYFYSIKPEWRASRPEARQSWFAGAGRKSDRSMPPTPLTEYGSRDILSGRSRSGSNLHSQAQVSSELAKSFGEKKRRSITLSKMIRIDVDPRKRSSHPEIIYLHYDRLHNPENCYHLELQWLNVTSKLVDDAIVSWTTQAEKYGLKLVEVPIAEASKVPLHEPFRAYYRISLALEPPQRSSGAVSFSTVYFTATSFTPQATPPNADIHIYQKALLKRFNFVLDLEAVSEFPENVEIRYSWGRLDYRYTQFVHRSGVVLAQITDTGDILLLANRLYNSRLSAAKDERSRFENLKKEGTPNASKEGLLLRPQLTPNQSQSNGGGSFGPTSMSASGIIALNVASPRSGPFASPLVKPINTALGSATNSNYNGVSSSSSSTTPATAGTTIAAGNITTTGTTPGGILADTFGSRRALVASGFSHYVTPEQIKDDLETFCNDKNRLEAFYREVTATLPQSAAATGTPGGVGPLPTSANSIGEKRRSGGTSSSMLRPIREPPNGEDIAIPELNLPEAVSAHFPRRGATN